MLDSYSVCVCVCVCVCGRELWLGAQSCIYHCSASFLGKNPSPLLDARQPLGGGGGGLR